jgi:hypothetical protein
MVAEFLHRGCVFAMKVQTVAEGKSKDGKAVMRDFEATLQTDETIRAELAELRKEVEAFAAKFEMPGF